METLDRVPVDATVVMVTLTSADRREATVQERWSEEDLVWKSAFTISKWWQRHAPAGAGYRRFPCLTFNLDVFGKNRYRPHPHHHVVVVLPHTDETAARSFAQNIIWRYLRAARDAGVAAELPGQDFLIARDPRRVIRYASKAMGFVIGHPAEDHEGGVTLAELGLIATRTGDADALERWIEAMTHRTRLMAPGGALRAS